MARVLFDKVTKSYGDVHVVKELNLEIRDQELLVLVGPSGCGKSTTLRMIAGLEEVTSGRLLIGERVVNDIAPKDRDIAMVFQNYALYPHMSVFENMSFALKLRKLPKADIEQRVREVARTLDLEHLLERKPKQLSGGQRQRVAMGRAIVRNPAVFLFDEPLSNLDAKLRVQMRVEIAKLHKRLKTTIVYVTHDQVEAMTLADRIVVMKDGYVQQVGPPLELYDRPTNAFVAGFIGSPSMNFLRGTLQRHDDALRVQSDAFSIQLSHRAAQSVLPEAVGQEVLLGFRPQALNPLPEGQAPPPHATFTSRVDVVEPMGAETYYYLEIGGVQLVARSEGHTALRAHHEATFAPDLDQLHLFSADGAQRLN